MTSRSPGGLKLSSRERDVLRHTARGMSTAEVAAELGLSLGSVSGYLTHAAGKLGSSERPGMVHQAYTAGELNPPERTAVRFHAEITPGERWVLQGLADGRTLQEIAASGGLYVNTVRANARALRGRLGAQSPAHLITRAWELGLLGPTRTQRTDAPSTGTAADRCRLTGQGDS